MRKYLTQKNEIQSTSLQMRTAALHQLRDTSISTKETGLYVKAIKDADAARIEAESLPDEFECSCCKEVFPHENNFVAVEINNVTAPRGQDQPLIKDYQPHARPYLFFCRGCALLMEIITQKELDSGRREGRFLV